MISLASLFAGPPVADYADEYLIFIPGKGQHGLSVRINARIVTVPYRKRIWIDAATKYALGVFGVPMVVLEQR